MKRTAVVAYHGHCFDGMASAALLTRFLRTAEGSLEVSYRGLEHQPGGSHVPSDVLSGDVNAVVDFRYTTSPRLTWFFDHHVSGIVGDQEREHLAADASGRKFFDPAYGSCCKLISDVARERFAWTAPELDELVRWADAIDAARFASADEATSLEPAAMRLMTVLEVHGDDRFLAPRIARLADGATLDELADEHEVKKLLAPLRKRQETTAKIIEERARVEGGVVVFDLVGIGSDRYHKFIPYRLFPDARYCVAVTAGPTRAKVSVGSNPWAPAPRTHDIAALCARYGGGGHPVVGAVSLAADQVDRARAIAAEIAAALRAG